VRIDIHIHGEPESTRRTLAEIVRLLHVVIRKENELATALDQLEIDVAANGDVEDSAILLLNQLGALILATDPNNPRVVALSTAVVAKAAALSAAVVANTPAAP
jgi:hypothetical protein